MKLGRCTNFIMLKNHENYENYEDNENLKNVPWDFPLIFLFPTGEYFK